MKKCGRTTKYGIKACLGIETSKDISSSIGMKKFLTTTSWNLAKINFKDLLTLKRNQIMKLLYELIPFNLLIQIILITFF